MPLIIGVTLLSNIIPDPSWLCMQKMSDALSRGRRNEKADDVLVGGFGEKRLGGPWAK